MNSSAPRTLPEGRTDFEYAFTRGATFTASDGSTLLVEQVSVGDLILPSGQLIVCDPCYLHHLDNAPPFVQSVAPGRYEVVLTMARPATAPLHLNRVACALLRFADAPAAQWMMVPCYNSGVFGRKAASAGYLVVRAGEPVDEIARRVGYWSGLQADGTSMANPVSMLLADGRWRIAHTVSPAEADYPLPFAVSAYYRMKDGR